MSVSWDDYAEEWDNNEDVISYSEKAFDTLTKEIDLAGLIVLDFGCGTGLLTEKISKIANRVVALDSSKKMISILNNKNLSNITTVSKSLSKRVIREDASLQHEFDLIVASSVLSFLPDYESTLILLKSLLAPNGMLIQWDWLSPKDDPDFGFTEETISAAYMSVGLDTKSITKPFSHSSPKGDTLVIMGLARKI